MTVFRIQWRTTDGDHYAERDSEGAAELFARGLIASGIKQTVIYAVDIHEDQAEGEAA